MSYTKNQDLLDELNESVDLLRSEQNRSRNTETNGEKKHLIDYFQKREQLIRNTIENLKQDAKGKSGETFHQIEPSNSPVETIEENLPAPDGIVDFISWNLKRQEELACWCETLSEKEESKKIPDVFGNLADQLRTLNRELAANTRSIEQK